MHFFEELNMHTVWAGNIKGSKVVATGLFEILQQKETDFWPAGTRVCWNQMFPVQKKLTAPSARIGISCPKLPPGCPGLYSYILLPFLGFD